MRRRRSAGPQHSGLVAAAQAELAAIYSAPRALPAASSELAVDATLREAREILTELRRGRFAVVRSAAS